MKNLSILDKIRRKISYKIYNPYLELAKAHNEYVSLYPNLAVFAFDRISLEVIFHGLYEKGLLEALSNRLFNKINTNDSICLDIGSNIGTHSLYFSKYFKEVFSFEVQPEILKLLEFNIRNTNNIHIQKYGLSDSDRKIGIFTDQKTAQGSSQLEEINSKNEKTVSLFYNRVKKFDDIDKFKKIYKRISFIKVDVEGHEFEVFQGMKNFLSRYSPILCFEVLKNEFSNKNDNQIPEVIEFLNELGFKYYYEVMADGHGVRNIKYFKIKTYKMIIASKNNLCI